jgi:hypothetical protein
VISRDVEDRTETVRDRVRRTDVEVEQVGKVDQVGSRAGARPGYDAFDADFRRHHEGLRLQGVTYDQATPAYRYGCELAGEERFRGRDWTAIEPEARRRWEERGAGPWERFKESIRYAWDRARGAARAA